MPRSLLSLLLALSLPALALAAPDDVNWSDEFGCPNCSANAGLGTTSPVEVILEYNGSVVIAGYFSRAGNADVDGVARFVGSNWHDLGSGLPFPVYAARNWNGGLLVSVEDPADPVRFLDGPSWTSMSNGLPADHVPDVFAEYQGTLYAGIGDRSGVTQYFWEWNGTAWVGVAAGTITGPVFAMEVFEGELYLGGSFPQANGVLVRGIAAYDGSGYRKLGVGVGSGSVLAMHVWNSQLVVVGSFRSAGPVVAEGMAAYDGANWSFIGSALTPNEYYSQMRVTAVGDYHGRLIVGGFFDSIQFGLGLPVDAMRIAAFDGTGWAPLGSGLSTSTLDPVRSLAVIDDALWVGGYITYAGGNRSSHVARWIDAVTGVGDGGTPVALSRAMPNPFRAATRIELSLAERAEVEAAVFDVRGRRVRTLLEGPAGPGGLSLAWDGRSADGTPSPAGIYFLRVADGERTETRRLVRLP